MPTNSPPIITPTAVPEGTANSAVFYLPPDPSVQYFGQLKDEEIKAMAAKYLKDLPQTKEEQKMENTQAQVVVQQEKGFIEEHPYWAIGGAFVAGAAGLKAAQCVMNSGGGCGDISNAISSIGAAAASNAGI